MVTTYLIGTVLDVLVTLPEGSVDLVATSAAGAWIYAVIAVAVHRAIGERTSDGPIVAAIASIAARVTAWFAAVAVAPARIVGRKRIGAQEREARIAELEKELGL